MRREHCYYVYILQSASRRALYIGMTSNLVQRILQHKTHECEGLTDSYNAVRLVYWESFDAVALYLGQKRSLFARQALSQLHESFRISLLLCGKSGNIWQ